MKRCLTLLLLIFVVVLLPASGQNEGSAFNWSLGLQNVRTGDLISFNAPVQSFTGEKFRLVITPFTECYFYVVYESPGGEDVLVLYSGAMKNGDVWYSPVLELAPPNGSESLFIVASKEEQKTLAQRVAAFINNPGPAQRRALMNEVFRVRSEASKFKEAPEKPVLMGGASRGNADKSQGLEFSGHNTYVKTISIEH